MKNIKVTKQQSEFLKQLICLWWETPHTDISYNKSVRNINKILKRGTYKLGGEDENAIKHLMIWYSI